jgi:general secretion pathway protein K
MSRSFFSRSESPSRAARRAARRRRERRGVALVLVLGAITVLTVMLAEFQDEASAELGSALVERDQMTAEYAAKSAVALSRLLIASEPTIRRTMAPLFLMMRQGPPQIPVWAFADGVLGAFNDAAGSESFASLAGVNTADGKNLGLPGASFEVVIIDEDSKINVNSAARADAISKGRLAAQLLGLMTGPQYDPLFSERDRDGQFSDRQSICSAIVDWADPDTDAYPCDPHGGTAVQGGSEDGFYQRLTRPYARKNAAYDSLEELRLVRGVGDDFWATFVDPDPSDPKKRVMTVWGQGTINVNSANPQTILAIICAYAVPGTPLCTDLVEAAKFLSAMNLVKSFTAGAPLFGTPRAFLNALKGKGMFGSVLATLQLKPITLLSDAELLKAISTESKVFSIYATGTVKSGTRDTKVRLHAVVDFRGAPAPGVNPLLTQLANRLGAGGTSATGALPGGLGALGGAAAAAGTLGAGGTGSGIDLSSLPEGATGDAIVGAFRPSAAGNVVYYRYE